MTNLYYDFFDFYTILHFLSSIILSYIGFKIFLKLNKNNNKKLRTIFIISFSLFSATLWEFCEFATDFFLLTDNQRDKIIYNFSSKKLKKNNYYLIKDIDHTIIYDKYDNEIIKFNGYLDIGLIDTMLDLFVNFIGSVFFSLFLCIKKE